MKSRAITLAALGLLIITTSSLYAKEAKTVDLAQQSVNPIVKIETSKGNIFVTLDANGPRKTTENFLSNVNEGFYSDTIFHRVIKGFMIQGGGLTAEMEQKISTHDPIKNEGKQCDKNTIGSIAMARTSDPDSATTQFFINTHDNNFLNYTDSSGNAWGYCAFGQVIKGMDVVEKIEGVSTTTSGYYADVPVDPVVIKKITIVKSTRQA